MSSLRGLIFLAVLPGLLSPAGITFRLCFCWLFDADGHDGCSHSEAPLEPGSHERHHEDSDHPSPAPGPASQNFSEANLNGCFCVTISVPQQPKGDREAPSVAVDVPAMDQPVPAAIPESPNSRHSQPIALGERSVPPTLTSRTLPLLI